MEGFLRPAGGGFSSGGFSIAEGDGQTNVPTHLRNEGSFTMTMSGYSVPQIVNELIIQIEKHNFKTVKNYIIKKYLINNNTFSTPPEVIENFAKIEDIEEFKIKVVELINLVNFSKKNSFVLPSGKLIDYFSIKSLYNEALKD